MPRRKPSSVKIIPLGGLGQIGMNITAFECNNQILIVDCGLAFPDEDMLGIDLVIPDITYLKDNASKIRGLVITHGHEDHIGAIPYFEKELNVPIYATKLTMALIENKLKEHGILNNVERHVVTHGDKVKLGIFNVEFIKTNHYRDPGVVQTCLAKRESLSFDKKRFFFNTNKKATHLFAFAH